MNIDNIQSPTRIEITQPAYVYKTGKAVPPSSEDFWGKDGFGFADLIDFINPLQHIPIVSTLYRSLTGDEISPAARLVGGALLGGVFGAAAAAMDAIMAQETGKDIGGNMMAMFAPEKKHPLPVVDSSESVAPSQSFLQKAEAFKPSSKIAPPPILLSSLSPALLSPLPFEQAVTVTSPFPQNASSRKESHKETTEEKARGLRHVNLQKLEQSYQRAQDLARMQAPAIKSYIP